MNQQEKEKVAALPASFPTTKSGRQTRGTHPSEALPLIVS
jgi:hypothetical protein